MTRRILVTGGAGFIGASLVRTLLARGDQVVVLDSGAAAGLVYLDGTTADVVQADIRDERSVATAIHGVEAVVHLAAQTSIPASIARPLDDLEQNALGTLGLLEAARSAGVDRFILASSTAVLGPVAGAAAEGVLPRPASPYGASKLAAEAYLSVYHSTHGMATTALRIANVFGPFSLHNASVVAAFARAHVLGEPLTIFGSGAQTRDFFHVDDLISLCLAVLDAPREHVAGQVFQAGSGVETSIGSLAELLFRVTGERRDVEYRPARAGDVARSSSDITKARDVLGYTPQVELGDGLASTVRWFETALADPRLAELAQRAATGSD